MATKSKKEKETLLLTNLARGATVAKAAEQAGVSERTAYRRLRQPAFQARIQALQDETLQRTTAVLTAATQEALQTLVALQAKDTPPNVRRAAAHDLLEMGLRFRESVDLDKRLCALEKGHVASDEASSAAAGKPVPVATTKRRRRGDNTLQMALAAGSTVSQAASKAGVSERTVYRRLEEETFQRGIETLRTEMVQRATAVLIAASLLAAKTLIELQDSKIPASVRRRAARDLLEMSERLRQVTTLEKRMVALESRQIA